VAPARLASITPVRPEEAGPLISLSAPRGKPPVRASKACTPVETVSGAMRSRNSSVEERRSPSEDSICARKVAAEDIITGRTAQEKLRTTRRELNGPRDSFAFYSPFVILLRGVRVVNTSKII
jgi:hypothetical protein